MATVYTTFAQSQVDAALNGADRPTLPSNGGNLHCVNVSKTGYTAATADPLYLVKLPKGARVIPQLCSVDHGDPGDACTGTVGYIYDDGTGDADGYATQDRRRWRHSASFGVPRRWPDRSRGRQWRCPAHAPACRASRLAWASAPLRQRSASATPKSRCGTISCVGRLSGIRSVATIMPHADHSRH